jgi:hypothetical protein
MRWRRLTGFIPALFVATGLAALADPVVPAVPLANDHATSAALMAKAKASDRCLVSDLSKGEKGQLFKGLSAETLPAGRYRLHAAVAAAPLGTLAIGVITVSLQAGETVRDFSAVNFPQDDEFSELALDFTLTEPRKVPVQIDWRAEESEKTKGLLGRRALEIWNAQGKAKPGGTELGEDKEEDEGFNLYDDGVLVAKKEALSKKFHLLGAGVHIERLSPVALEARTDKMVYKPGQPAALLVSFRNTSKNPVTAEYALEWSAGLSPAVKLPGGSVPLPAGATVDKRIDLNIDTAKLRWGAEARITAAVAGQPPETARAVFAVSSNIWETAILAAHPAHMAAFDDPKTAREAALRLRENGFTGFEAFFWGPCDMFEFTPDQELFFSGQTGYPGTKKGTKNLLDACHDEGLCGTFYANLWGGSGPPSMEVMRRHPEWFGNANYNTSVLNDWDLMGPSGMDMADHKVRAPGIATWCFTQLYIDPPAAAFKAHADEMVASQKMFGWDGVRYDSFYSRQWSVRAMRQIRAQLDRESPGFGFGYNSFAWNDYKSGGLEDMVRGGQMIMAEGIRVENSRSFAAFLKEMLSWREVIWAYGGQGPGMLFRDSTDEEAMTPVGIDYQASLILAAGGHFYYNPVKSELGQYARFALRFSEFIYDNRMRPLKDPGQVVSLEKPERFLLWQEMARTVDLGGSRHRLVMHIVNTPAEGDPFKDKTMKAPAPVRDLPVTVHLPAGAKVNGVWSLAAVPDAVQTELKSELKGADLVFSVPEIRFWTAVVVDFESEQGLPTPVSLKEKSDTCIQDWWVIGPFTNDLAMSAVKASFPPEEKIDLKATYPGAAGKPVAWKRTLAKGAPALGRLPLDFRAALDGGNGAPGCAYAYTELVSDSDRTVCLMGKADDTLALWVNGAPVEFKGGCGEFQDVDEGRAVITLKKGNNTVLVKVCEKWLYWMLALRVADENGNPVPAGVSVSAEGRAP